MAKLIPALPMPPHRSSKIGRRNIRRVNDEKIGELTLSTIKEEEARKKRLEDRNVLLHKTFGNQDTFEKNVGKLILDFDPKTKKELISVDRKLVEKLKPHQIKGIKFLWDACFGTLEEIEKGKGSGCILAHCMGLGKTFQVVSFVHTLLHHEKTNVKTVLILSPATILLNWKAEFKKWLKNVDNWNDNDVYVLMAKMNKKNERADYLDRWAKRGGIMIMGYEMFSLLTRKQTSNANIEGKITSALQNPGPDVVICDEGHVLKNENSALSKAMVKIKTSRRILLSGTPLQNNLNEYYCMVQFVRPNLLGSKEEFRRRFINPITNGQYNDSTSEDVKFMKERTLLLHRTLEGIVQRFDQNVLKPFLPSKHEFVLYVALSDLQAQLYEFYINKKSLKANYIGIGRNLFRDYQIMLLIWTHPLAMKLSWVNHQKTQSKEVSGITVVSVGDSLQYGKDGNSQLSDENELGIDFDKINISTSDERVKKGDDRIETSKDNEINLDFDKINISESKEAKPWWYEFISKEDFEDYSKGPKIVLLLEIIKYCEQIGDKVLIFSQSIPSLDMIEYFLKNSRTLKHVESNEYDGVWEKNLDYFRLDGQTPSEKRMEYCEIFNKSDNMRARLFLISTKAGGLGINLTAANRVIIFDACWNPSYDIQSIFRAYRLGQKKLCYVYRLVAQGTMEEKIYVRQITKQSTSCRVVDEQEIVSHFAREEITQLYTFNRKTPPSNQSSKSSTDSIMEKLLEKYSDLIISYHEHDSLLENVEENHLKKESKVDWKDIVSQTVDKIQSDWILRAVSRMYPNQWKCQEFDVEKILFQFRRQLFYYYMDQERLDRMNKSFMANNSVKDDQNSFLKIPSQALIDTIQVAEVVVPAYLQTREKETGNEKIRTQIWSRKNFLHQNISKIGMEKIEEKLQQLYSKDWKDQRFQVREILKEVRRRLWKYYLSDNRKDQLNQLIVAHVFDGLVQNAALEIENQALTDIMKDIVPAYLQTPNT